MRKLLLFALPFGLGTALCQYLLPQAWRGWAAAALLLAGLGASFALKSFQKQLRIAAFGLAAGLLWFSAYSALFLSPAQALVGTEDTVTVELLDYAAETSYGASVSVRVLDRDLPGRAAYYGGRELMDLSPGDRLTANVKYYSAVEVSGDASTYHTARGVFLRLYGKGEPISVEPGEGSLRFMPQELARRLREAIDGLFQGQTAAFITALLTGERDALDEQSLGDLEESGLMHVTAVSGLHCGFLIGLLGFLLARRYRLTALVGYPVLLLYMLAVGCTPSVVRSCVMMGFLLLAPLVGRESDTPTALSAALLVILLANPFAIASLSLQLSFAAMAGLLLVTPRIYGAMDKLRKPQSRLVRTLWVFLVGTASASLGAMVFTAPLGAFYFKVLALYAPLSNLLVLWAAPLLFGSAMLVTALSIPFPFLAPLAALPELLTRYVLWAAGLVAKLPGHAVYFTETPLMAWLLLCYAMLAACAISRARGRTWAVAVLAAAVCLFTARSLPAMAVRGGELTVVAVDVGQGAATLLSSGGSTALVDCGSHYSPMGPGATVAAAMDAYGWGRLDAVVLTHYHADHAGGLGELLSRVEIGELFLPQLGDSEDQWALQQEVLSLAARYGVPVTFIETVAQLRLGRGLLTVYPPLAEGSANEEGLTILCSAGDFDILITGDMDADTEELLIAAHALPDIEVLMVGHHGSKYSTSEALLEAVTPEIGIISVGQNTYGHPAPEAMARMTALGMTIYRTDLQGDIRIQVH